MAYAQAANGLWLPNRPAIIRAKTFGEDEFRKVFQGDWWAEQWAKITTVAMAHIFTPGLDPPYAPGTMAGRPYVVTGAGTPSLYLLTGGSTDGTATFTIPSATLAIQVLGGGGGGLGNNIAAGGGGGADIEAVLLGQVVGSKVTLTAGRGGKGGGAGGGNGDAGNASSFGAVAVAGGGGGTVVAGPVVGAGGTPTTVPGVPGAYSASGVAGSGGSGGNSATFRNGNFSLAGIYSTPNTLATGPGAGGGQSSAANIPGVPGGPGLVLIAWAA